MSSQVDICNLALHRLGQERISSISDNVKRAIILNDIYSHTLKEALECGVWNFAIKRATLTNTGTPPSFEYSYQFVIPSDMVWIWEEYNGNEFKLESTILSNSDTLDIIYIYYNTDPATYSQSFIEFFSLMLAAKASYSITQDKDLTEQLKSELKTAKDEALFNTSKATRRENVKINTFLAARY